MQTYSYVCIHLPDGQRFPRVVNFHTLEDFYRNICRWNTQRPDVWAYAPMSDTHAPDGSVEGWPRDNK